MGILAGVPVITLDRRSKTREVVTDYYGERFCLDSIEGFTSELITDALESFDPVGHEELVSIRKRAGVVALGEVMSCLS